MSTEKTKIFVSAYACEPGLGSEIGVGWHWVLEMSKHFELWVLTRESNRGTIEPWIALHHEFSGIHFLYFDLPKWARFWKKGMRGVRTYYNIWQLCTNRIVKRTMRKNDIKVFHHLTYGNVLWKVSSYGQKQFFVWGPVGGLETIPAEYSSQYARKSRLIEWVRRMAVKALPLNFGFKKRCRCADLILCKTEITRDLIPARHRAKAVLFTDVAVEQQPKVTTASGNNSDRVEFITVGRLDAWRGFDLVIESFARVAKTHKKIHLTIVGKGADKERLKGIINKLGLQEQVTFTGKVAMDEYYRLLAASDVVVNASLKEGAVTVSFDSMAMGKPLICLDTTGYTRYFSNEYAIVIPRTGREEVIDNLAAAMERMTNADERKSIGEKAKNAGAQFTWAARCEEFKELLKSKLYIYNYAKNEKL
ncbi:MAG: glycosyltransferase family 4 protein [Bacteroidaceae bacterium]|nr:glycosyltransferase family 4 protein [Bacteroidaceae bacterium]